MQKKDWTGERLETHIFSDTTVEHLHRYSIALEFIDGKKVLDIACGEGYGTNLLAQKANHITGIDLDSPIIKKAITKYKQPNISFICGNGENLPFENEAFDVVVSFETIEHIANYKIFLSEIRRVLTQNGLLIISTPNKLNFSDVPNHINPFHVKEFYQEEFIDLLKTEFTNYDLLHQEMSYSSFIFSSNKSNLNLYCGDFDKISTYKPKSIFFVAFASNITLPIINNSLFVGDNILDKAVTEKERNIKNSISYKIGHILLFPLKAIRNLLKK